MRHFARLADIACAIKRISNARTAARAHWWSVEFMPGSLVFLPRGETTTHGNAS